MKMGEEVSVSLSARLGMVISSDPVFLTVVS